MEAPLDQIAYQQATWAGLSDIVAQLEQLFGMTLTAYVAGVSETAIGRYARGEERPTEAVEARLRATFRVARLLDQVESPDVIRAWFTGMNPYLDDASPAEVIREDAGRVLRVARRFVAEG